MNYCYRIYPSIPQKQTLLEWMDICSFAYNYGLREIKDWCNTHLLSAVYFKNCGNCGKLSGSQLKC